MEKQLLTIPEAGAALGVSRSVTYTLIADGRLESVKIGRSHRVPAEAVKRLVDQLRASRAESR